jgi:hypothetical protein
MSVETAETTPKNYDSENHHRHFSYSANLC